MRHHPDGWAVSELRRNIHISPKTIPNYSSLNTPQKYHIPPIFPQSLIHILHLINPPPRENEGTHLKPTYTNTTHISLIPYIYLHSLHLMNPSVCISLHLFYRVIIHYSQWLSTHEQPSDLSYLIQIIHLPCVQPFEWITDLGTFTSFFT